MDIQAIFLTLGAMALAVTMFAELIDKWWDLEGTPSQIRSLVIGVALGEVGGVMKLGFFGDPATYGDMAWYVGAGVIGLFAGVMANWSFTTPLIQSLLTFLKLRVPMGNGTTSTPTADTSIKKVVPVVLLLLLGSSMATAQTWDNFWHPRPHTMMARVGVPTSIWEFKPLFQVAATRIRAGATADDPVESSFLSAAGPALTLQKSSQTPEGQNYADYSVSLALLLTGDTTIDPTFQPAVALTVGFYNNLLQVGAGYELTSVSPQRQRLFGMLSVGVNLTNN